MNVKVTSRTVGGIVPSSVDLKFSTERWMIKVLCLSLEPSRIVLLLLFLYAGNRETAYLSAINSASLAWTITRYCTKGELTMCTCDHIQRKKHSKWTWGGCSEDVNYGIKQARQFVDPQEDRSTSFGLMNLHNNEAARRVSKFTTFFLFSLLT